MGAAVRVAIGLAVLALLVAVDVQTKRWAADELRRTGNRVLADGHVVLRYVENRGIAFGLLRDVAPSVRHPMLVAYATAVSLVLAFLLGRRLVRGERGGALITGGMVAMLAGTLGNLHDRLERGYVIDFIDYSAQGKVSWPTFNVADAAITAGLVLCALGLFAGALRRDGARLGAVA